MKYFVEHSIWFRDTGATTAQYQLDGSWKTSRGALKAAERLAKRIDERMPLGVGSYDHRFVVKDENGIFVTNLVA